MPVGDTANVVHIIMALGPRRKERVRCLPAFLESSIELIDWSVETNRYCVKKGPEKRVSTTARELDTDDALVRRAKCEDGGSDLLSSVRRSIDHSIVRSL